MASLIAAAPSTARVDAYARAQGNRLPIALKIGTALFVREWPAQVLKVAAFGFGSHTVVGLRISGVKFHRPLSRIAYMNEIASLALGSLAAAPIEEVDISTVVPLSVGKGVVVAGDLAKPTSRTVFAITIRRGETRSQILARMRSGAGVYWDQAWAGTAFASPRGLGRAPG